MLLCRLHTAPVRHAFYLWSLGSCPRWLVWHIGFSVALLAARQGARVSITSSNPTRVANAVTKLKSQLHASTNDPSIQGFVLDLAAPDVEQRLEQLPADVSRPASSESNKLDHIVVTAGRALVRPPAKTDRDPRFLRQSPGCTSSLVFCGGRASEKPIKGWPAAAAYAAGLNGLTRALALGFAPMAIRVNVVHPGATETEIWGATEEQRWGVKEAFEKAALLGKVGRPEEVAEAFVYLLRDSNATGVSVHSSGGVLVQ
ncbi:hypothetical protein BDW71DRAFT_206062 [Aspergillus fruticulosus]